MAFPAGPTKRLSCRVCQILVRSWTKTIQEKLSQFERQRGKPDVEDLGGEPFARTKSKFMVLKLATD